jgi:hypothetical protein
MTLPFWYRWKWRDFGKWWDAEGLPIFILVFIVVVALLLRFGFFHDL